MGKQFVLLCSLAISCLFSFASKEINKVSFQYFNSEQLTRLPEFFSGKEYTGKRIFCRSNSEREGLYFSFPLNQELLKLPSDSKITLSVIRSGQKEAEVFSLSYPINVVGWNICFWDLQEKIGLSKRPSQSLGRLK